MRKWEEKYNKYRNGELDSRIRELREKMDSDELTITKNEFKEYEKLTKIKSNFPQIRNIVQYINKLNKTMKELDEEISNRQKLKEATENRDALETELVELKKRYDNVVKALGDKTITDEKREKIEKMKSELSTKITDNNKKFAKQESILREGLESKSLKWSFKDVDKKKFELQNKISKCVLVVSCLLNGFSWDSIDIKLDNWKDAKFTPKDDKLSNDIEKAKEKEIQPTAREDESSKDTEESKEEEQPIKEEDESEKSEENSQEGTQPITKEDEQLKTDEESQKAIDEQKKLPVKENNKKIGPVKRLFKHLGGLLVNLGNWMSGSKKSDIEKIVEKSSQENMGKDIEENTRGNDKEEEFEKEEDNKKDAKKSAKESLDEVYREQIAEIVQEVMKEKSIQKDIKEERKPIEDLPFKEYIKVIAEKGMNEGVRARHIEAQKRDRAAEEKKFGKAYAEKSAEERKYGQDFTDALRSFREQADDGAR